MTTSADHRTIAHFDLDSFFVSVERRKNPSLCGKPIAVGGHSDRGVIASCSYEARKFGVKSAMPTRLAKRLCPELIIVHGDMDSYCDYSRLVTDIISEHVPLFEKSSIDEFYIDMTGMDKFFGCARYTAELRQTIIKNSGLSISYGLSSNKLISKVATNEAKPNGQLEIAPGDEKSFLAPMSIDKLPMVGKQTSATLRSIGIETIGALSETSAQTIIRILGKHGMDVHRRANGIDETPVVPYREQKSIGTESTFESDTVDMPFLNRQLIRMTEKIAFDLRDNNKLAGCVTVKIRYSDFHTVTMQSVISYTAADHVLLETIKQLFDKLYDRRLRVRLIGVRLSHLVPGNYQIHLFDDTQQTIDLYQAIDHVKNRFGENKLIRAAGALLVSDKWKKEEPGQSNVVVNQISNFATARKERKKTD